MAGIMKFFKPTDGPGGNSKKAERCPLNTTTLEPFPPVGCTDGPQHIIHQSTVPAKTDVELGGGEASTGSKRKRGDSRVIAAGGQNATASCRRPEDPTTTAKPFQQQLIVPGSSKHAPAQNHDDVPMADVDAGLPEQQPDDSSPEPLIQHVAAATDTAATEQMLSPDVAALQPTAKRARLPEEADALAGNQGSSSPSAKQHHHQASQPQPQYQEDQQLGQSSFVGNSADTSAAAESTPLPRSGEAEEAVGMQEQPQADGQHSPSQPSDDGAMGDAAAGGAGGAAAGVGPGGAVTGAKSGGAGPATLPVGLDVEAAIEDLRREQRQLEAALEEEQLLGSGLQAAAAATEGGRLALMPNPGELCTWLEGRTQPLSALVPQLAALLPAGTDPTALRTALVDLAHRKCYSAKEDPLDVAAASEDTTPGRLWIWEVREPKKHFADKATRKLVDLQRKRRKELRERLVAVFTALDTLTTHQTLQAAPAPGGRTPSAAVRRTAESRAAKAWSRLSKLADLEAIERSYRSASNDLAAGGAAAGPGPARKERERKDEEKARLKEEKARAKEEEARAKEEKARQKEEEARAKEAKRAQEEEAKRRAREVAAASKAGFASKEGLRKSQNIMESFFKRPKTAGKGSSGGPATTAAAPAGGAGRDGAAAQAAAVAGGAAVDGSNGGGGGPVVFIDLSTSSQAYNSGEQSQAGCSGCSQPAAATPVRGSGALFDFSKLICRAPNPAVVAALDSDAARLPLPLTDMERDLQSNHQRWRQQRAARKRMIGVPPTWARRPSAPTDIRVLAAHYYGDVAALGLAPEGLRTWRRKLIAFPAKESARPPYYGSFSRTSTAVTGRRPFGRDSTLDYEVASDEEWEEEPEGESLSDSGDEADSLAGGGPGEGGEEEDDGFIVGDDHLSDDEGAQLSGDPDDPMDVDGTTLRAARTAFTAAAAPRHIDPRLQQLEAAIDRVRTNNRPILLVRPPSTTTASAAAALPTPALSLGPGASPAPAAGAPRTPGGGPSGPAAGGGLPGQLRAEPRAGLNTGLDPGLLGALRPVVHRPGAALAPPLELDVYSAYAAAAAGGAGGGCAAAAGGLGPAVEEGGAGAFAAGPDLLTAAQGGAAGPSGPTSGRAPGSGHRGRTPAASLSEATLTALAELMASAGDQKMEKIVEVFLANWPPGVKLPAKIKLREAIKRLGSWSHSAKRWILHGGSVAAAVAHALEAAAAVVAAGTAGGGGAGSQKGTPLPPSGPAGIGPGPAMGATGTPPPLAGAHGGLLGLPIPTLPRLGPLPSPLPTPSTAFGGQVPFLPAPACTPLEAATAAQRPMGQVVVPQQLAQALAKLAADGPAAPSPMTSAMTGDTAATPGATATPVSALGERRMVAAAAGGNAHPVSAHKPAVRGVGSSHTNGNVGCSIMEVMRRRASIPSAAGTGAQAAPTAAVVVAMAQDAAVEPMDCDAPRLEAGGQQAEGEGAAAVAQSQGQPRPGPSGAEGPVPQAATTTATVSAAVPFQGEAPGGSAAPVPLGGSNAVLEAPWKPQCDRDRGAVDCARATEAAALCGGEKELPAAKTEAEAGPLPRPMPPPPPSAAEMAAAGTAHPYWGNLTAWVLGGGGAAGRARKHGPSWADVSAALAVFEAGELEPRLPAMPLDVVRALVSVCQHRRPSHLRSGAFKALGNVAAALAAVAAASGDGSGCLGAGGGGAGASGGGHRRGPRQGDGAQQGGRDTGAVAQAGKDVVSGPVAVCAPSPRPTGQPSRCSPQPVSLPALWRLPGLLAALRRGCCDADPDSETDKAARGAARVLAALVGVGIRPLSADAPFATLHHQHRHQGQGQPEEQQAGPDIGAAAAAAASPAAAGGIAAEVASEVVVPLSPALAAAAAAFRLRVASDPDLHAALRDAATQPPRPSASPARCIFAAHMLLALQWLLRDSAAAPLVTKPKARVAREAAAAAEGRPAPAPPGPDLEARWAAKVLQTLVVAGRGLDHPGCRKGLVQSAVSLLEHPRLAGLLAPPHDLAAADGEGGGLGEEQAAPRHSGAVAPAGVSGGVGALLTGNDPCVQVPAVCLTLLTSELRLLATKYGSSEDGGNGAGQPVDKCSRVRVLLALHAAERALRHLSRPVPSSRQQLRQADTKAAVADVLAALEEAGGFLYSGQDSLLRSLSTTVGALAEELA